MVRYAMIEGHPGYRVGTDGSVWSCIKRGNQKGVYLKTWTQLKTSLSGYYGHQKVFLHAKQLLVHVLVLEAFRGPRPFPDWDSRHLDGNAGNNRLTNLKWGTKAENGLDRIRHGTPPIGEGAPEQ